MVKSKPSMSSGIVVGNKKAVLFGRADESTQGFHANQIKKLENDSYEDGTYNISTLEMVQYSHGYQVTFCQIGDDYSATEYADLCNEFLSVSSDGIISAGKFGGTPEVSFNVADLDTAIQLAKKYNQISIWDWAEFERSGNGEMLTGGTGERKDR